MLQLYDQKPISIFLNDDDQKIRVQFCNIKMKMKMCQFRHFNQYLLRLSSEIEQDTDVVDLLLVRDSLNISISLNHFFQLSHAVALVMAKKFENNKIILN